MTQSSEVFAIDVWLEMNALKFLCWLILGILAYLVLQTWLHSFFWMDFIFMFLGNKWFPNLDTNVFGHKHDIYHYLFFFMEIINQINYFPNTCLQLHIFFLLEDVKSPGVQKHFPFFKWFATKWCKSLYQITNKTMLI